MAVTPESLGFVTEQPETGIKSPEDLGFQTEKLPKPESLGFQSEKLSKPAVIPPPDKSEIDSVQSRLDAIYKRDYAQPVIQNTDFGELRAPDVIQASQRTVGRTKPEHDRDSELRNLTQNYIQFADTDHGFMEGLVKAGSGEGGLTKIIPFVGALASASQKKLRNELLDKIAKKKPLTEMEKVAVDSMGLAQRRAAQSSTVMEQAAEITGSSIPYAAEFGMTGGIYSGAKALATKGGGKILGYVAPRVGGVAAQTAAASAPRIASSFYDNMAKSWNVDPKELSVVVADNQADKDWSKELAKAGLDSYIENLSERTGGYLGRLIPKEAVVKLFRLGAAREWVRRNGSKSIIDAAEKLKGAIAFHGITPEIFEEYVGEGLRSLSGINQNADIYTPLANGDVPGAISEFVKGLPIKDTPAMAVSFGLIPAAQNAASLAVGGVQRAGRSIQQKREDNRVMEIINQEVGTPDKLRRDRSIKSDQAESNQTVDAVMEAGQNRPSLTPDEVVSGAHQAWDQLDQAANGTWDDAQNGKSVRKQNARILSTKERELYDFLSEHKDNPEKLADTFGFNLKTKGEQNANRKQSAVPEAGSDQAQSVQTVSARAPGNVRQITGASGGQAIEAPRPFTPPPPVEVPQSAPIVKPFIPSPVIARNLPRVDLATIEGASEAIKVSPTEFYANVKGSGLVDATQAGYKLAESIKTKKDRDAIDSLHQQNNELLKPMEALIDAEPDLQKKMAMLNEMQFIGSRGQYYNEAVRLWDARELVSGGMSVADAAQNRGVEEHNLVELLAVNPATPKPKGRKPRKQTASMEFDRLVLEHGMEAGWVQNPDVLYDPMPDVSTGHGTASIKAKILKSEQMAIARHRAAKDIGISPNDVSTPQGRGDALAKLKAHVDEKYAPVSETKQASEFDKATKAGKLSVPVDELQVGHTLDVEGETITVTDIDPETHDVTISDGRRFGTQTLKDGTKIYAEDWSEKPTPKQKPKEVSGNGKENEKGKKQKVLKPKTGSPEKSGGQSPKQSKPKESNETITDTSKSGGDNEGVGERAASYLRRSVGSDKRLAEGPEGRKRQWELLAEWATKNGALVTDPPATRGKQLSLDTNEHYVVLNNDGTQVIKWTWPATSGSKAVLQSDGSINREYASPLDYLERIKLQNEVFGDDIRVIGFQVFSQGELARKPGGLSIVTTQPFRKAADINNPNPTRDEIWDYMTELGFVPDAAGFEMGAWRRKDGVLVVDARADNFVKTKAGIVPIDLQMGYAKPQKPAIRNLTKAEQNRFAVLAAKARDARDNAGEPLTGAELREYQDLEKIAGAQDLLVEPTSANDAAIEGEVKRLRAKAAELDRQAILTHNRANASNVHDVKNKLRKAAYDLDKEATAVRNKADELEATLKRKVGGNDLVLKAEEPKVEKPTEAPKEEDLFGPSDKQASIPSQVTPVGQPQAPVVAKTLPELRALVNSPASGLSKEAVTLINAFLDSPLADTLDGLTVKIQDVVETGWDGSYFQGVVELARNADPKAGVHEFLHRAWEVLPQDIKAEFERMRVESLKDELAKTDDPTRKQQIQDLIDNPTTGTADFLARGLPRDLYELSRAEELFTHSGSDQFKAKVGSIKDGFWARVKEFLKDFIAALKKAFKFKQSQEDWLRNILNGNFRIDPDAAGYAKVGNAVITTRRGIVDMAGKASLTAHHGTPHKVDKFTTAKIGTGEGAQVYGWGIYLADRIETAESYASNLSIQLIDGNLFNASNPRHIAWRTLSNYGMDRSKAISIADKTAIESKSEVWKEAAQLLRNNGEGHPTGRSENIYTVSINANPDELLDWDKPLSEQSEKVKMALAGIYHAQANQAQAGKGLYARLVQAAPGKTAAAEMYASKYLLEHGIKGIRFLDQGSRQLAKPAIGANGKWNVETSNGVQSFDTESEAIDAYNKSRTHNYVIFNDADISITHENGKPVSVGEVVAGKQGALPTSEVADNAELARAEAGLNLTDLEMPKDIQRLAEEQGREGVPTETFNIVNFVAGRQRLDDNFRQAGQRFTQQVFAEIGIPVRSGPSDLSLMADPANPDPVAWTKMIDRLKKELSEQRVEGRADATGGLVNFLDSLILMWQTQRNAFEQMPPEIGRQLFQFAQGERSFRGLLLGAMAHLDNSVTFVGQNVDTMLQRVWSDEFNGAVVSKIMDRVLTEFKDFFTDEELRQIAADAPDLQQTVDEIIKRTRDANMSDKVYQRASAWLKPKKPKGVRALQADARVKEAVNWLLDAATKAGIEPTKPVPRKMTPEDQLLHLLTPGVAPKIQESIENAFTEMEWDAAISASKPDDREALMEAKLAGEQPDPELVAKGLALPKFAKWVATRDFVTNNLLGYNPVTLKLVQDLVSSDFSGTKFGKPVAKPAVTKIDLVALAKSPDTEVKRVLDAYLADIEANMQMKGAPPELRQRIRRMIYMQVRDQIAARREDFIQSFISPKKSLPLSASVKLRQLINAGISKDSRFQNDKVRQLIKKIAGEYTKDVPFESLATSTRAEKQQWMERKAEDIAIAEKFSQYDEDTRAQLEATVWTYLAERLQAAEEGITRQFLRGNDVKYDREQLTPEQRQASLDAAKSKIEGLVRAGAFDASMVEAVGGKSSLAKLTPGLPELIKAALETPFYRQSELGEQFADKLVSEFSIDEAQRDKAKAAFNRAFGNKFKMARSKAADKAYESLMPQEKKAMPQRSPIWRKIERVVNADANFSTGETLRQIAKDNGWEVPSDEQIALVKDMSEQIQRLRELTAEESAAITDPALKAQAAVVKTAATQERRVALKRQIETYWARWTQPITLKSQMGRANAVSASYEFSAANLLFRLGFMTRQGLDVFTQIVQHIPTRSIGNAIVQHGGFWKNAGNVEFWRDASSLLKQSISQQVAASRPALREFREAMRGTAEAKNVDRLMSGIALFERMDQKAGELDAAGKHGQAFAMRFFGMVKFSYRFASALDNLQGVPQEWQEMRTQAFRTFRDNGMTTAEAKVATDTIIGDLKADHLRARALARQYLDATGRTPTKAELDAAAWHVVKALAYQRMRDAGMPADDFEERNRMMRSTNAWNEGIANVNSVGGVVANLAKRIGELGKSAAKAHPALMPIAAVAASFGRFGNAMGTAIDRSLTYTPIGLFPSAFGVNDQHIDPDTGIAGKGSPWFRTREDRAQRKVESSIGTAFGALVVALVLAHYLIVRNAWPKDKAKRDLWDRMGWKPGTVAFQLGDGQEIVASMTVGPMAMLRPYLAGAGALRDALDAKAEKQAQLNAEAEKLGLPPGEVKPLDMADMFSIAGNTMWASIMGGRTASGLVGSLTDYGTFNPSKTAAATVSPLLIGLPAVQEASRMAGVSLDANLATFSDFLVPMPTSGARRVNLLGDPSGTPSDMQRIVQILTGGTYPGITSSEAAKSQAGYSALFQTGYRPPSINPNKAYAFDGAYRPMKDEELSKYTQLRGQYLKEELANLGDNPDERSARAAYQTANARALSEMGVQSQSRRAQPESQPTSRSVPSSTSNASVSTPRFARVSAGRGRIAPIRRLKTSLRSSQRVRPLRPLKLKRQKYAPVRAIRKLRFA